jgi:hypothetical protein
MQCPECQLNRLLQIDEKDPPDKVREKIESGLGSLVSNRNDVIPYLPEDADVKACEEVLYLFKSYFVVY